MKPSEFLSTKIHEVLLGPDKVSVLRLAPVDSMLVLELFQLEFVVVMADPKKRRARSWIIIQTPSFA